jgi:hypothetical protein
MYPFYIAPVPPVFAGEYLQMRARYLIWSNNFLIIYYTIIVIQTITFIVLSNKSTEEISTLKLDPL